MPRSTSDLAADAGLEHDNASSSPTALADKSEDLETLRNAVVEAAGVSMGLWLSYLFVLFYFAIAAGGVTHRDLFFENPIKLPFLNVDLPLVGFFVLAPGLVLIVHAYVLLHVVLLSGKIRMFNDGLGAAQLKDPTVQTEALRRQLPSNISSSILPAHRACAAASRATCCAWLRRSVFWCARSGSLSSFSYSFFPSIVGTSRDGTASLFCSTLYCCGPFGLQLRRVRPPGLACAIFGRGRP